MNDKDIWLIIALVGIFLVILWWVWRYNRRSLESSTLHQRLDMVSTGLVAQMQQFQQLIQSELQEHRQTLQSANQSIGTRLDQAALVFGQVQERLAQLEEGSKRIFEVGKDLSSLHDILRAPKLRGSLGELFLGDMLAQILSKDQFSLQHTFKSGEKVDAVVRLQDGLMVPIDAKFPLENFRRTMAASESDQIQARRAFKNDVKKHIDAIAEKYILPAEGTFDFALMYIPAENVYYEIILKDDDDGLLLSYAFKKRVIPVSPNTLYIYLQAILLGLKGLQVEKEAVHILQHLQTLNTEFAKFGKEYAVLGGHLTNAQAKYVDTERMFSKITGQLESLGEEPKELEGK